MKLSVEFLPTDRMRYCTAGDWFERDGVLCFQIAETGNSVYDRLVLIHEMVEQLCCEVKGVTEKEVDDYDFSHDSNRDPGDEVDAPYRDQHCLSTAVERLICAYLGLAWRTYDAAVLGEPS